MVTLVEKDPEATYVRICRNFVRFMRVLLKDMSDEARVKLFDSLSEGYCRACGSPEKEFACQCENDE